MKSCFLLKTKKRHERREGISGELSATVFIKNLSATVTDKKLSATVTGKKLSATVIGNKL